MTDETEQEAERLVAALTIAGSDSGGNAGIQADLRAFHAFGVHGCVALAALTAQNLYGVQDALAVPAEFVVRQIDAVIEVYGINALKTGMLASAEIAEAVSDELALHPRIAKIVDPVMVATSGATLLAEDAVAVYKEKLLPLASLSTPNIPETEKLTGMEIHSGGDMVEAAKKFFDMYGTPVIVKGGHFSAMPSADVLFDGTNLLRLRSPVVEEPVSTHGTGCSLSAAIAASAACGRNLVEAVVEAKAFVYEAIRTGKRVGEVASVMGFVRQIPGEKIVVEEIK